MTRTRSMSNNCNSKAVEAIPSTSSRNPIRKTKPIVLTAKTRKIPSKGDKLIMLLQADLQYVTDDDEDRENHIGHGHKQNRPDTPVYTVHTILLPGTVLLPAGSPLMRPPTLRNFLYGSNNKSIVNKSISINSTKPACL
jgi:hypothetical protein